MDLPAISDIFFIMVLVLPGYFSLKLIRNLGELKRQISDSELTYLSLTCSLIIYIFVGYILKINNIEEIKVILIQPDKILLLMVTTIGIGLIIGVIIRQWRKMNNYVPYDPWRMFLEGMDEKEPWIIVFTTDGNEYKGVLGYYGEEHESKELTIFSPIKIIRDTEYNLIDEINFGVSMYFAEKDISKIIYLKSLANSST